MMMQFLVEPEITKAGVTTACSVMEIGSAIQADARVVYAEAVRSLPEEIITMKKHKAVMQIDGEAGEVVRYTAEEGLNLGQIHAEPTKYSLVISRPALLLHHFHLRLRRLT